MYQWQINKNTFVLSTYYGEMSQKRQFIYQEFILRKQEEKYDHRDDLQHVGSSAAPLQAELEGIIPVFLA